MPAKIAVIYYSEPSFLTYLPAIHSSFPANMQLISLVNVSCEQAPTATSLNSPRRRSRA